MGDIHYLADERARRIQVPPSHRTYPYTQQEDGFARTDVVPHKLADMRLYVVFANKTPGHRGFHVFRYSPSDNLADKNTRPRSHEFMSQREFMQSFHSPTPLRHGLSHVFQMMAVEDTRSNRFAKPDLYQRSIHSVEIVVKEGCLPHNPAFKVERDQLLVHFTGTRKAELMSQDSARLTIGIIDPATERPIPFDYKP